MIHYTSVLEFVIMLFFETLEHKNDKWLINGQYWPFLDDLYVTSHLFPVTCQEYYSKMSWRSFWEYGMMMNIHTGRLDIILMSGISLRVVTIRIRKFENGHLGYTLDWLLRANIEQKY